MDPVRDDLPHVAVVRVHGSVPGSVVIEVLEVDPRGTEDRILGRGRSAADLCLILDRWLADLRPGPDGLRETRR